MIIFLIIILKLFQKKLLTSRYLKLCVGFSLGFAWALCYAHMQSTWTLPTNLEGKNLIITGYIASIPDVSEHRTSFLFSLETIQFENTISSAHGLVRLSWQDDQFNLHVGEKWQLPVRLKRIHGTMNPGGFDYEAWSFQEGIRANGYVISINQKNRLLPILLSASEVKYPIDQIRQYFRDKIAQNLPASNTSQWITALAIGERRGITSESWQVLRNTGTNHLMAIAGLHIGFMSAFIYGIVIWLWRRIPRLALMIPAQHAAGLAALCMALIYSAMAGFSIPTQRACFMFSALLIIVLLRRSVMAWQVWSLALIGVLLMNPLSVLTESFWLSFGSVALIIYGMKGRLAPKGLWWKYGRIQWVIAVGLIPLSIWLFQQCSIVSFIANSIAIPWVGFLVVPFTLLGCFVLLFSAHAGGFILLIADKILQILWVILAYLSYLPWSSWYQVVPNAWSLIPACIGMIVLLLPIGFPGRWLGLIWLLPLILYKPVTPECGEFWFTLLDVGQGLSAVVQTQKHILIFDAGPKLSDSFDMGESVILPFLRTIGTRKVDMLVVSHGDNDHIGGSNAILQQIPVSQIKTSVTQYFSPKYATNCLRGESWDWENVHFEFVYPSFDKLGLGNDSSCVLRISAGKQSLLLTGDIEKLAEKYLVNSNSIIAADIIVAPHHGSKTSGVDEFIKKVNPKIVLFPIGYRNRYHFPHKTVLQKYQDAGVVSYDTASAGAIQYRFGEGEILTPMLYRFTHKHYWNMIY